MSIQPADLVLSSNAVFTGQSLQPQPASIAIVGERIVAVGSEEEVAPFIGERTQIYHVQDQLIMPGFHDFHVHIVPGSIQLNAVHLQEACSEAEAAEMVKQFADSHAEDDWIIGFSWDHTHWDSKKLPTRAALDRVLPDRPVLLNHVELHYAWVNSKALELMGITRDTKNPTFGEIARDEQGELTGILYEQAIELIVAGAYSFSKEKKRQMITQFFNMCTMHGITSLNDMYSPVSDLVDDYDLYREMELDNELNVRIHLSPGLSNDLSKVQEHSRTFTSDMLQVCGVKFFIDGVITGYTAYMLDPYTDKPETCGHPSIPADLFKKMVVQADRAGYQVRVHAIGDAGVRLTLDAFAEARQVNGASDHRHAIEHIESIHPDDIKRFGELGVIASVQPQHLALIDRKVYESRLGAKREQLTFAFHTLQSNGALLAFGSDFPVTSIDPMLEIYRAVTRVDFTGSPDQRWHGHERISLGEALLAYTRHPAYGSFREHELGTLEVGKLADLVVLDRNLFTIPPEEILETAVQLTVLNGTVVYNRQTAHEQVNSQ